MGHLLEVLVNLSLTVTISPCLVMNQQPMSHPSLFPSILECEFFVHQHHPSDLFIFGANLQQ